MTNAIGSTSLNLALQVAATRPANPAAEAVERERQRESIEDGEAVRQAHARAPATDRKKQKGRVDRYV